ncbi:hypothetical protein BH11VER1_BH11VER1_25630 [soil metagenome]
MLVIWALMLISVAVIGALEFISYSVDENVLAAKDFRALHMAECGIAVGLHPQVRPGDPSLKQTIGTDGGYEVKISTEGSRIPVTYLTDPKFHDIVYELFILWKLSPDEANTAVDSLADWMDNDDNLRSQGAESDYYKSQNYADFPRQQAFTSLEEMLLVKGMDVVERMKPDWRNYFSIYSDGIIDLNYASKEILMAVTDCQESDANNLIRERSGADGIAGTDDDKTLSIEAATKLLGLDSNKYQSLQSIITTEHLTRRVESVGRSGSQTYKVVVIARRQTDGSLNYLARLEE